MESKCRELPNFAGYFIETDRTVVLLSVGHRERPVWQAQLCFEIAMSVPSLKFFSRLFFFTF